MLRFRTYELAIRPTSSGRLEPWVGSALRGVLAYRLKEMQCRHSEAERLRRWIYCDGCPHVQRCAYGKTYESQAEHRSAAPQGVHVPPKPVVVSPFFPLPEFVEPGHAIPLRTVLVGDATVYGDPLFRALASAGRTPGLGPDRVTFELGPHDKITPVTHELRPDDFPCHPGQSPGLFPRVGVGLSSPLFLSFRDKSGRRGPLPLPNMADLFLASWRIIANSFWFFGERFDFDTGPLLEAARRVPLIDHCYEPYTKTRTSSRQRQRQRRHELGVVGGAVYGNVPAALVPWLVWGGRLHVGRERVAVRRLAHRPGLARKLPSESVT